MANNNSSGTTKRRKRRKSITYKTARERKRLNSSHRSEKSLQFVGGTLAQEASIDKDSSHRTNSDSSVSALESFETEQVDSVRNNSLSTASTSKVPAPLENNVENSPEKRLRKSKPSKQKYGEKSGKDHQVANSPKNRKTSQEANDEVEISLNESESGTRIRRKSSKSVTFTIASEKNFKKRLDSHEDEINSLNKSNKRGRRKTAINTRETTINTRTTAQEDATADAPAENSPRKRSSQSSGQMSSSSLTLKNPEKDKKNQSSNDSAPAENSPRTRSTQSSSSLTLKNPKRAKTTKKDNKVEISLNNSKSGTRNRRKSRKTITFITASEKNIKKRLDFHRQSEDEINSLNKSDRRGRRKTAINTRKTAQEDAPAQADVPAQEDTPPQADVPPQADAPAENSPRSSQSSGQKSSSSLTLQNPEKDGKNQSSNDSVPAEISPRKRSSQSSGQMSSSNLTLKNPKRAKTTKKDDEVQISLNDSKSGTRNHRKSRKSITFTTARERKTRNSHRQVENNPISSNKSNTKGKKKMAINTTTTQAQENGRDQSSNDSATAINSPRKWSSGQMSSTSSSLILKNPKRTKTTKKDDEQSSEISMTKTTGHGRAKNQGSIPDRIRDLMVTKKAFRKWKPLAKSTVEFVEQTLKSVVLNVIAHTNAQKNQEAMKCLTILKERVLERLPHLKAPYTQGDYRKMESQNKESEEVLSQKSKELNTLEEKIEEEQRCLEVESAMVEEYTNKLERCKKELASLDNEEAHPLIRGTENVLDLPELPEEYFNDNKEVSQETACNSAEEIHLARTLSKLRQKTGGWKNKMDRLGKFVEDLEEK